MASPRSLLFSNPLSHLLPGLLLMACGGSPDGQSAPLPGAGGSPAGATAGGGTAGGQPGAGGPGGNIGGQFAECGGSRFEAKQGLRAANIVWVIDTSGSMDEEASLVQENLNSFVQSVLSAGLEDYRVVVVSERSFVSVADPLGADRTHFLYVEEEVGSEEPLEDLLSRHDAYASFLIPSAITHFVVVTDDESAIPASSFISQMDARLTAEFRVHAIASPPGEMPPPASGGRFDDDEDEGGCVGPRGDAAAPGVEHYAAAKQTGGLVFSICAEDWSGLFSQLASEVGASAPIPCQLNLPTPATGSLDPSLINVLHTSAAGVARTFPRVSGASGCASDGWYYDNQEAPKQVLLCPAACSVAKSGGALEIAVGCQTVVF